MIRPGCLSQYFAGVAFKRLRAVEVDRDTSNQHEFNGVSKFRAILGDERITNMPVRFIWLAEENASLADDSVATWYDARENQPHRSPEYRLYFKSNDVMDLSKPGDLFCLGRRPDSSLLGIVVPGGSTLERQLLWLFGADADLVERAEAKTIEGSDDILVDFVARIVLDELGIEYSEPEADRLDRLLASFGTSFPTTAEFSSFARRTARATDPVEDPDDALLEWMDHEERLFRRLERRVIGQRLAMGFAAQGAEPDIDGFLAFSLGVQNRRKSRVGRAFEHHFQAILAANMIHHSRGEITENRSRPDFVFPGISEYRNPEFSVERLTILGVKSTCKDRWRQVLAEADRVPAKHLLTTEPGISVTQTDEMRAKSLQLIVPRQIHQTYTVTQCGWLMDVASLVARLRRLQSM